MCLDYVSQPDLATSGTTACCYRWACDNCVAWLAEQPANQSCVNCQQTLTWSQGSGCDPSDLMALAPQLQAEYQAMVEFYQASKGLPWCLGQDGDSSELWQQYYQAEVKAFELAQDHVANLLTLANFPAALTQITLPKYSFERPGVIVTNKDGRRAVVTDYYGLGSGPTGQQQFRDLLTQAVVKISSQPDAKTTLANLMHRLSSHCLTTWAIVRDNLDLKWNWYQLASNPNMPLTALTDSQYPWDLDGLVQNRNVDLKTLTALLDQHGERISHHRLSLNPNLTWAFVLAHPRIKWNYKLLGANPSITFSDTFQYASLAWEEREELREAFSANPNVTEELVAIHTNYEWSAWQLSSNPAISWAFIAQRPSWYWNYWYLAGSRKVDLATFLASDKLTSYKQLSANPNVTWPDVQNQPELPWDWYELSLNVNMTWAIIQAHPQGLAEVTGQPSHKWRSEALINNPNVDLKIIRDNVDLSWQWSDLFWSLMNGQLAKLGWWRY